MPDVTNDPPTAQPLPDLQPISSAFVPVDPFAASVAFTFTAVPDKMETGGEG